MTTTAKVGMIGLPPKVMIKPIGTPPEVEANPEASKYATMWEHPEYREVSPGEMWAQLFLQRTAPRADSEIIDYGCGTGRGGLSLALFGNMKVRMLDFAPNCLDEDIANATRNQGDRLTFAVQDLTQPIRGGESKYGYCCDVMEHIPPADVRKVLQHILTNSEHVFFGIATAPDKMGALIGAPLHLTVQPMEWWINELKELGATVHWFHKIDDDAFAVYVTAWRDAIQALPEGTLNVEEAVLNQQVLTNVRAGWRHLAPCRQQDREIVILAGGPTMNEHVDEIRALREGGAGLITVNGSYAWAREHGLSPSCQIVLDGREFNARFTRDVRDDGTQFLIASQCHPSVLEGLPKDRTLLWHSFVTEEAEALIREMTGQFFPVPGGSTVVLRAIPLMLMLGYRRQHLFGFDSCVLDGAHHGYVQAENDGLSTFPVTCGGRTFQCEPWMISQANQFQDLCKSLGDEVELQIHGRGLIAAVIEHGAALADEAEAAETAEV